MWITKPQRLMSLRLFLYFCFQIDTDYDGQLPSFGRQKKND